MNYKIFIPTYKRSNRMIDKNRRTTPTYMSHVTREKTFLVIRPEEEKAYERVLDRFPGIKLHIAHEVTDVVTTRDAILKAANSLNIEYLIMIDDDIEFAHKPLELVNGKPKYITMDSAIFDRMINDLMEACEPEYPITGITARQFSNNKLSQYDENTRIIQVYCIHMPTWRKEEIFFSDGGMKLSTDYYFILEHLARGYKNRVLNSYTRDDNSQTPGGCQTYRTTEMQSESAKLLYKHFPEVITLKWKNNGTWKEPRLNPMIRWKKAYGLYERRENEK